jgi:conjugal transfer ATP-binding protein TraC
MLKPIISLMAAPKSGTNDDEDAIIESGLNHVWRTRGREACITDLTEWMTASDNPLAIKMGNRLATYSQGGAYGRFFNGKSTVNFDSNLIVVELEEIKAKKDLLAVVMQIFMFLMTNKLSLGDRLLNRAIFVDEAWSAFEGKQGREFMENFARTIRKLKGCLIAGTQNINDFYTSPAAEVVFNNLDWLCLFTQKKEAVELLKKSGRFMVDDYTQKLLASVRTKQGEYSEMMILHEDGAAIGRFIADPFARILYSSTPDEVTEVEALQAQGLSLEDAIAKVADGRYGEK